MSPKRSNLGLAGRLACTVASIGAVLGIAATIEITGGLPSQLAHLYYCPWSLVPSSCGVV